MKNANTGLAIFTLTSCIVSTICLCLLCYTLYTGELPMDLKPMLPDKPAEDPQNEVKKKEETAVIKELRKREDEASGIYIDLVKERSVWKEKNKSLAEREKNLLAIEKNIKRLLEEVRAENNRIQTNLETIALQEVKNLKQRALELGEMEPKIASKIVLRWEMDAKENAKFGRTAPRVLYYMEPKKSAAILEAMAKEGEAEGPNSDYIKRVTEIMDEMRRLNPEITQDTEE
ncbi:hypothetical protein BVX99_03250 [bacterium F16]|nr:hypothetical protein BVX99_03250 [bacterium F16]